MQILYVISLIIGLLVCSSHQFLFLNNIFKGGLKSGLKLGAVKSTKVSDTSPPPKENCQRVPHKKCQQVNMNLNQARPQFDNSGVFWLKG